MKKTQAVKKFGSIRKLAQALGVTDSAVSQWGEDIPELRVYQIREVLRKRKEKWLKEREIRNKWMKSKRSQSKQGTV